MNQIPSPLNRRQWTPLEIDGLRFEHRSPPLAGSLELRIPVPFHTRLLITPYRRKEEALVGEEAGNCVRSLYRIPNFRVLSADGSHLKIAFDLKGAPETLLNSLKPAVPLFKQLHQSLSLRFVGVEYPLSTREKKILEFLESRAAVILPIGLFFHVAAAHLYPMAERDQLLGLGVFASLGALFFLYMKLKQAHVLPSQGQHVLFVWLCLLSSGSGLLANGFFDFSATQTKALHLVDMREKSVEVESWRHPNSTEIISVGKDWIQAAQGATSVNVEIKSGLFGLPWVKSVSAVKPR